VERAHCPAMISLFWRELPHESGDVLITGAPAHHARVRRVGVGDPVRLIDGRGRVATGAVGEMKKDALTVVVEQITTEERPQALEVLVPVADRDRMLLAAEKAVELQATSWRPVKYVRSGSVASRGEGERFRDKLRARMEAALEQSGGAWLPDIHGEADLRAALSAIDPDCRRLMLDRDGAAIADQALRGPVAIAIGPEGGFDPSELRDFDDAGWIRVSLGYSTLRFETAVIAGLATIRAAQFSPRRSSHG